MHAQAGEHLLTLSIACPAACITLTAPLVTSQRPAPANSLSAQWSSTLHDAPCMMHMRAVALFCPVWGKKPPGVTNSLMFARHLHQDR